MADNGKVLVKSGSPRAWGASSTRAFPKVGGPGGMPQTPLSRPISRFFRAERGTATTRTRT
jgi:hypothetical protein